MTIEHTPFTSLPFLDADQHSEGEGRREVQPFVDILFTAHKPYNPITWAFKNSYLLGLLSHYAKLYIVTEISNIYHKVDYFPVLKLTA